MTKITCVCGKEFELAEGVDIIPHHLDENQQLCKGSGRSVKDICLMAANLLIGSGEEPGDCPPGYSPPEDCGVCANPACFNSEEKVRENEK